MANGRCALTEKTGKFVKSHLLPKALTRPEEPGLPFIQSSSGKRAIIRRDSWYDKSLVTKDGEKILADLDDWAIKFLRQSKLVWSGWGVSQSLPEQYDQFQGTPNGIRKLDIDKPELLRLFFLSLLWRAAATNRPEFSEITLSEEELSKLGHMLITGTAKPFDYFPISLIQITTRGVQHNHSPIFLLKEIPDIENGKTIRLPIFRFYLDGLIIHLDCEVLSTGGNRSNNPMVVGANKELLIGTVDFANSSQKVNLQHIMRETVSWPHGYQPPQS